MFFHSHWSTFPQNFIEFQRRCLNLQRIYWHEDGWPFFETGSVKREECAPQMTGESGSVEGFYGVDYGVGKNGRGIRAVRLAKVGGKDQLTLQDPAGN